MVDLRANSVDHLGEIVRRDISRHPERDSSSAVYQQIWKRGGKNCRLSARLIVIRDKIDRVSIHIGHERGAEMRHACLRVTHGRRRIAFYRTEIALTVDESFAHRPGLSHVHKGRVDHRFAVWMVVTAGVPADFCALAVLPPWKKRQVVHRVKNSSLRRLEPVARIRQRTGDNHRHRIIEERPRDFFGHVHRFYFFVRVIHGLGLRKYD